MPCTSSVTADALLEWCLCRMNILPCGHSAHTATNPAPDAHLRLHLVVEPVHTAIGRLRRGPALNVSLVVLNARVEGVGLHMLISHLGPVLFPALRESSSLNHL